MTNNRKSIKRELPMDEVRKTLRIDKELLDNTILNYQKVNNKVCENSTSLVKALLAYANKNPDVLKKITVNYEHPGKKKSAA